MFREGKINSAGLKMLPEPSKMIREAGRFNDVWEPVTRESGDADSIRVLCIEGLSRSPGIIGALFTAGWLDGERKKKKSQPHWDMYGGRAALAIVNALRTTCMFQGNRLLV